VSAYACRKSRGVRGRGIYFEERLKLDEELKDTDTKIE
jgi:hypothetical protein